jgi:ABC-type Zn uptake system ZnuABC Zn-binding protein ZnuA
VTRAAAGLALVAVLALPAAGCGREPEAGKLKVAATIAPIADFCRQVGGDLVDVEMFVPSGASPHTYEPTSRQMVFLSDAGVFVHNGLGLEGWVTDLVGKVGAADMVVVDASARIPGRELIEAAGHEPGAEPADAVYDPHVWLDPNLAILQVEAIRDGLVEADPANAGTYRKNARLYISELEELDGYVKTGTSAFTARKFVAFHPAFTYFARRYGLEQVGVIEELPGREPGAGEISRLIDLMEEQKVQVVFTEPQFSPRAAEAIAAESGGSVVVRALDPLGDPDDPETATYIALMRHDVGVMSEVMK